MLKNLFLVHGEIIILIYPRNLKLITQVGYKLGGHFR